MQPHIIPWQEQGVQVLFATTRSASDMEAFIAEHDVVMPVLLDGEFELATGYGVRAIPAIFVIDHGGIIQHTKRGWGSGSVEMLQEWIDDLAD